jgi:molybdopterin molybdotransferase
VIPHNDIIDRLLSHGKRPAARVIDLAAAAERVVADPVLADRAIPAGDESLRDGFALAGLPESLGKDTLTFALAGEIAAGGQSDLPLQAGQAWAVMTGAAVPPGTTRVVPQEFCRVVGRTVEISVRALAEGNTFLQKQGSLIRSGEELVGRGELLSPARLERLAAAGLTSLRVFRRPEVAYFCTGRELVAPGGTLFPGGKYSSNQFSLAALITRYGGSARSLGLISDEPQPLQEMFTTISAAPPALLLSTGGTGPGRYDLVAEAFAAAGGFIEFHSLPLRPGNSVVFGWLGRMLFCGLPGPPWAVQTLFSAIVGPLLLGLHGVAGRWPMVVEALLAEDVPSRERSVLTLHPGVCMVRGGRFLVRSAGKNEPVDCYLLLPAGGAGFPAGTLITVQLCGSPFVAWPYHPAPDKSSF